MNRLSLSPRLAVWPRTWPLRKRGLDAWLLSYLREQAKRKPPGPGEAIHVLLCIADHYEPKRGNASPAVADERVACWLENYRRLFGHFRDSDGRPPRHTFFYPQDEYEPRHVDALASLCRAGFGEVEVHLHHDNDTAGGLRNKLESFKHNLAERHGLLSRHRRTGRLAYAFIHGNWALDNSRPDGRMCGVNNELDVLRETGCCADFTMPSCPSPCQTRKINSIYYAVDDPRRPKSHDTGIAAGLGTPPQNALLLIQGPLLFNWNRRKWGILPRVENGCIQATQPPTMERLDLWLRARVQVPSRPDWYFVKLFMHGAKDQDRRVVLGEPMVRFHEELARRAAEDSRFHFHYVTAREMANLVHAAENGWSGDVEGARDFELLWNGAGRPRLIPPR
ncbi:MAG TPA: hypothetical protein VGY66_10900 [Gemmataceae bacterium]|jgi:hypothetical protein|nr:hypothetical protein [Gemmataceae bacterium]